MNTSSTAPPLTLALAGNTNVGKSSLFSALTGGSLTIGATMEQCDGWLNFDGREIRVIDLPGIYSVSTYTEEESISRDFILSSHPDVVINVVNAAQLERNLYFTSQLLELDRPMVLAVNQLDTAAAIGIEPILTEIAVQLSITVVGINAERNIGITELLQAALNAGYNRISPKPLRFGYEVESRLEMLEGALEDQLQLLPRRLLAIALLEKRTFPGVSETPPAVRELADRLIEELREIHGEEPGEILAAERWAIISRIAQRSIRLTSTRGTSLSERFDRLALHPVGGYFLIALLCTLIFGGVFYAGNWVSGNMDQGFEIIHRWVDHTSLPPLGRELLWAGVLQGVVASLGVALPYLLPFYLVLGVLESSGYLARIAVLTDRTMHELGLHGKAFIPILLGFGCNVPGVVGTRVMESRRERVLASIIACLVPCSARTIVILGLAGAMLGPWVALGIYVFVGVTIFVIGRVANRVMPGRTIGLVMEMPPIRLPKLRPLMDQTWFRIKDFLAVALPLIVVGNFALESMRLFGLLPYVTNFLSPIMFTLFGLPPIAGTVLLFGILRKELTLIMLVALSNGTNLIGVLSPAQMITFSVIAVFYFPCLATVAALRREFGWREVGLIVVIQMSVATILGALVGHILPVWYR